MEEELKKLKEVPKEYYKDSDKISELYSINKNIFDEVNFYYKLPSEIINDLTLRIASGELRITEKNVKILECLYLKSLVLILDKHFEYSYLIEKNSGYLDSEYLKTISNDLCNIFRKNKVSLKNNPPEIAFYVFDFVYDEYANDLIDMNTIKHYISYYSLEGKNKLLDLYINKNLNNISTREINEILKNMFNEVEIKYDNSDTYIETSNTSQLLAFLEKYKYNGLKKIIIHDNNIKSNILLSLLMIAKENNIELAIDNGFKISSNLIECISFIELTGGIGTVKLDEFEPSDFMRLYEKTKDNYGLILEISLEEYMEYEEYLLSIEPIDNIRIVTSNRVDIISLTEMHEIAESMDEIVESIKEANLSPFEQYILAYNYVKVFKDYRLFYGDDKLDDVIEDQSRNPYLVMRNDSIVCEGYCALLKCFLDRLGIHSKMWELECIEYEPEKEKDEEYVLHGHARLYVNIVDPKYNINGYYMCDPTWDNVSEYFDLIDGFDYLCMTTNESHNYEEDSDDYYNFGTHEEYFNDEIFRKTKEYFKSKDNRVLGIVTLKELDPENVDKLSQQQSGDELFDSLLTLIGNKTNNSIPNEVKAKAILSCADYIYGEGEIELEELLFIYGSINCLFNTCFECSSYIISEEVIDDFENDDDDWEFEEDDFKIKKYN